MPKRKIPEDTDVFVYDNVNPKNKHTDDCSIRAIANAMERPYAEVYREMFELSLKTGYFINSVKTISKYLANNGWIKQSQPRKLNNTKFTGAEWCEQVIQKGIHKHHNIIANIGGHHIIAIKDGQIHDTWDSSQGCIGNYWLHESNLYTRP